MKKALAIAGVTIGLMTSGANAEVINFDEFPVIGTNSLEILNEYAGFNWNNWYVLNSTTYYSPSGYSVGAISKNNVSYNGFGNPAFFFSSDIYFTVNSLWATAAWNDGLSVTFTGYDESNNIVRTITVNPSATNPTLYELNWAGIYKFGVASTGGTHHAGHNGSGNQVAIDDITVNAPVPAPVPVPATLALLGLGLAGIGAARRSTSPR